MLTKTEVEKTYWIGMSSEQYLILRRLFTQTRLRSVGPDGAVTELSPEETEVLDDLRQSVVGS